MRLVPFPAITIGKNILDLIFTNIPQRFPLPTYFFFLKMLIILQFLSSGISLPFPIYYYDKVSNGRCQNQTVSLGGSNLPYLLSEFCRLINKAISIFVPFTFVRLPLVVVHGRQRSSDDFARSSCIKRGGTGYLTTDHVPL